MSTSPDRAYVVGDNTGDAGTPRTVPLARGTTENAPSSLLQRAWQSAASSGAPAVVLARRDDRVEVDWVNRPLLDLLGVDRNQLEGVPLTRLVDVGAEPGSALAWARVIVAAVSGPGGQREAAVRRLDGSDVRVQLDLTPLAPGPGQQPDGWLAVLHPLTDSVQDAEAALREAEHRFTALATSAPIGIVLSEAGLRLGYVNDRFIDLFGTDRHALLGTGWLERVAEDDRELVYEAAATVLGGAPSEATVRLVHEGREQPWVHLRLAPTITPARAAGFIGIAEDITQRRAWEERITYQAQHDALTGLVNRRRLVEVLGELMSSRRAPERQFGVLFIDLDGFKAVNDTYGHEAGDRVLIEVARRLQRTARDADLVARMAGDEFVVVLRGVLGLEDAERAAARHLDTLAAPYRIQRNEVRLSASIGIALPGQGETPESILRAADGVMYDAKQSGHGRYRVAPVTDHARSEVNQ